MAKVNVASRLPGAIEVFDLRQVLILSLNDKTISVPPRSNVEGFASRPVTPGIFHARNPWFDMGPAMDCIEQDVAEIGPGHGKFAC